MASGLCRAPRIGPRRCAALEDFDVRLLLVEDDVMVASGIKLGLTDAGYAVDWVGSGERAEEVLRSESFDAAIIDIGLPGMDGLELTRRLRRADMVSPAMPVLILTARDALHDRVQGLDLGADDYMVKPFELPELLARLRALLRRSQAATTAVLSFGPLELDTAGRRAARAWPAPVPREALAARLPVRRPAARARSPRRGPAGRNRRPPQRRAARGCQRLRPRGHAARRPRPEVGS